MCRQLRRPDHPLHVICMERYAHGLSFRPTLGFVCYRWWKLHIFQPGRPRGFEDIEAYTAIGSSDVVTTPFLSLVCEGIRMVVHFVLLRGPHVTISGNYMSSKPYFRPKGILFGSFRGEKWQAERHTTTTPPLYITLHMIHCWMHLLKSFHSPHSLAPGVSCVHTAVLPLTVLLKNGRNTVFGRTAV
jgi:hypothetical protein